MVMDAIPTTNGTYQATAIPYAEGYPAQTYAPQTYAPQMVAPDPAMFGPLAPQGFFGSLLGGPVGRAVGGWVGGKLGNRQLGRQIGGIAGGVGGSFLPFDAAPDYPMAAPQYAAPQYAAPQYVEPAYAVTPDGQLVPQGWFGDIVGKVAKPVGGWIGNRYGNRQLGEQIGSVAGELGRRYIPFEATPVFPGQAMPVAPAPAYGYVQ